MLNGLLTLEKPVTFEADGAPTISNQRALEAQLNNIGGVRFVPDSKDGCYVDIYRIDGPPAAVLAPPREISARDKWRVDDLLESAG